MSDPPLRTVSLVVNGEDRGGPTEDRTTLADFLREQLRLTGTHVGCEHGVCGACTVLVGGEAVRSCLMLAVQADGCRVETVEGLAARIFEQEHRDAIDADQVERADGPRRVQLGAQRVLVLQPRHRR